ncbi:hypothetical protein [Christiangramia sabulilitoris]|uniref:Uncharacterized protein n=1 Tax=Christiangramia sabulilitoris TaxID=2583991 RepID=A0A550I7N5_9FLAO|nr:hypothetical protein [Christiangramia sabulilitoris]TRO66977.1 hypothetical protein FGM01_03550 [Christiangramia sabulilitoris]
MKIQNQAIAEQVSQKVELVKGKFTRAEASHIITALIDQKVNFHKIQRLQIWEGDHKCVTGGLNDRITELEEQKNLAKDFISEFNEQGRCFKIKGTLEIIPCED